MSRINLLGLSVIFSLGSLSKVSVLLGIIFGSGGFRAPPCVSCVVSMMNVSRTSFFSVPLSRLSGITGGIFGAYCVAMSLLWMTFGGDKDLLLPKPLFLKLLGALALA